MLRFDEQASILFHYAREEAERLDHGQVAPEHLLLALLRGEGDVSHVLQEFGVTLEAARDLVEDLARDNQSRSELMTVGEAAQRVMELAGDEAQAQNSDVVTTRHILLGVLTFVETKDREVQVGRVLSRLLPATQSGSSDGFTALRERLSV